MSKTKFAQATEADWGFLEVAEAMRAIGKAAGKAAALFEHVTLEDAKQDGQCWLAVRPERVAKALETEDWKQLAQDVYANALRPAAMAEANQQTIPMSTLEREEGWQF